MIEISDYDEFDYDYSTYWKDREYENKAEHLILDEIFNKVPSGDWILDIGGSYGRLADTYSGKYKHPIIIDYSLETLVKNKPILRERYPNIILIAANAYYLPFKNSSIDAALMVRVLHHLNQPDIYFKELNRVLKSGGVYIQEFANKIHLKARIRAILKGEIQIFSSKPYQQPAAGNFEGTKSESSIFLNYHPRHIRKLFKENNLKITGKYGCSFLRIPVLKQHINTRTLISLEKIFQKIFSWTNIPPSIFFAGKSVKKIGLERKYRDLKEILVCPKCKSVLSFSTNTASCKKCGSVYAKENDIWDFRVR